MKVRVGHYDRSGYEDAGVSDVFPVLIVPFGRLRLYSIGGTIADGQIVYWSVHSPGFSITLPVENSDTRSSATYQVVPPKACPVYALALDDGTYERIPICWFTSQETES